MPCNIVKSILISNTNYCGKTLILEILEIGKKLYNSTLGICWHQSNCGVLTKKYTYKTALKDQAI